MSQSASAEVIQFTKKKKKAFTIMQLSGHNTEQGRR